MAKKNKSKDEGQKTVVEMAEEAAQPAAPEAVEEPKVDFDAWYASRGPKIPAHHHKEVIKADFKGRKVPKMATMAEFDEALKKYGIELA